MPRGQTKPHVPCPLDDLSPQEMGARRFKQGDLTVLAPWEKRHFRALERREDHIDRLARMVFERD